MATHNNTGKLGERLAKAYLEKQGFEIIDENWRYSNQEIDIIAFKNETLHFVEVKTRRSAAFGPPEENVSTKKIENLLTAGEAYLERNSNWKWVQYDILSINLKVNENPEYFFIEDVYL
ncbi:MAG: hypothetical protein C5B52_18075 [Bacteroidetes bacterium]|nr:MAG: hypothetical protein C5B52_18075 [Bacteroidota bacterium]